MFVTNIQPCSTSGKCLLILQVRSKQQYNHQRQLHVGLKQQYNHQRQEQAAARRAKRLFSVKSIDHVPACDPTRSRLWSPRYVLLDHAPAWSQVTSSVLPGRA